MKIISIGRGTESNIIIDNDLVSRRHATIKLLPFGKMEIRDLSKNGTYVNGIRLAPNKPYPVTRKDVVSFAQVAQLDWDEVPDQMRPYRIGAIALLAIIAALVIFSLVKKIDFGGNDNPQIIEQYDSPAPAASDKTDKGKDEAKEKERQDSIKKKNDNVKFFDQKKDKKDGKKQEKPKDQDKSDKENKKEPKKPAKQEENNHPWIM